MPDRILKSLDALTPPRRSSTITLGQFIEDTCLDVKTRKWKASTRGMTEQIIEEHIVKLLGDRSLSSIGRRDLQTHLDHLAANDKSKSVVAHVRWQLSAIFAMVIGDGLILVNPSAGLQTPRCKSQSQKRVMDAQDFVRAQMCLEIRERLIFLMALGEVSRPGEIMALKCGDIQQTVFISSDGCIDVSSTRQNQKIAPA
jgi:site-specific recombinase XerD